MGTFTWEQLPLEPMTADDLLRAAAEGRVLVASDDKGQAAWPYPIKRVRLAPGP